MTIQGLNNIAGSAIQAGATAEAARGRGGQEKKISPSTAVTSAPSPAAIYHPSQNDSAAGLAGPGDINVYSSHSKPDENQRMLIESLQLWLKELPAVSAGLRSAYDAATVELSPELLKKDWGFSVSNGQLVVMEGSDALSEEEMATLKRALAELTPAANAVADTTTRMIALERGTNGVSNGIGRFDVSTENFADIVDLRKYLLAHGPSGKYNNSTDPSNLQKVYGVGGWAIMDQIEANASVRFSVPKFPF